MDIPKHRDMISVPADQFHYLTWKQIKRRIAINRIDNFPRAPLDHHNYFLWLWYLKRKFGSVDTYLKQKKLGWNEFTATGAPFSNPDEIKIVYNDWPYGWAPGIIHLCVWTKFAIPDVEDDPIPDQPKTKRTKVAPEFRPLIEDYVDRTFRSRLPAEDVLWFKNWSDLKSIPDLEHFHVLLNNPDRGFLDEVTDGDVRMSAVV